MVCQRCHRGRSPADSRTRPEAGCSEAMGSKRTTFPLRSIAACAGRIAGIWVRCIRNAGRTAVPPQRMHLHSASRSSSVLPWCIWHLEIFLSDRATPTSALALNRQDLEAHAGCSQACRKAERSRQFRPAGMDCSWDARLPSRPPRPTLPADQAIMPLCAAHAITISLTDRAADISLPSCTR